MLINQNITQYMNDKTNQLATALRVNGDGRRHAHDIKWD